jgi:gamma-glutamylcyclotransferase (GGCT)/AIG2-like uncharacterized protein YtfP
MHKVLVYGTLKKGFGNHRLLENAEYLGPAKTTPEYTMLSTGGFPAVIKQGETAITGELYAVTDEEFARLDSLEGYPRMYTRDQIQLDGREERPWIYIWNMHHDLPVVPTGVWEKQRRVV